MLVGFSVGNYRSFNEPQTISFMASKITRHKEHVVVVNNKRILKSGLIFGANAGGKSNLIKAIHFSKKIIVEGLDKTNLTKNHFRVSQEAYNQPAIFEYRIVVDGTEYSYGVVISYSNKEIISEWLIRVEEKGKETCIFNREINAMNISHATSEVEFTNDEERWRMQFYLEGFGENISDAYKKKTILSDIALRANENKGLFAEIIKVYEWFNNVVIIFPGSKYNGLNETAADEEKRAFFGNLMSSFDTGIESIEGREQEMDFDKILENVPADEAEKVRIEIVNAIEEHPVMFKFNDRIYILRKGENGSIVYNKMFMNHGNEDDLFEYMDESDGTKRLFDLIPLFYVKNRKSIILIDEIDRSLHTNLTKKFLQLFYEYSKEDKCQIIATTHDSNLLDLDLLRQDEIWFVERQEDHSSKIYSLNLFKERFDKKIDKEYLLGRYGAIPVFDMSKQVGDENEQ